MSFLSVTHVSNLRMACVVLYWEREFQHSVCLWTVMNTCDEMLSSLSKIKMFPPKKEKVCVHSINDGKDSITSTCVFNSYFGSTNFWMIWKIPTSDLLTAGVSSVTRLHKWSLCAATMYTTSTENTCKIAFGSLFHQKMEMLSGNISALLVSVSCFFASFTQSAIIPHEVIGVIPACVAWPYQ